MSTIDTSLTLLKSAAGRVSAANGWMGNAFKGWMPTGLYARALLIMIVPMVILQIGRRLRVHGAALEHGDAPPVGRGGAGHRRADRRLQGLSAGQGPRPAPPHRPAAPAAGGRFPSRRRHAAAGTKAVLLAARPDAVGAARPPDRTLVLDRHGRPLQPRRDPHPARRRRDARVRAAQRRLRLELGNLPVLDGRDILDPADRLGAVPAQPDQADPAACGRRGKFRQGPRGAELPAARRARGAARGGAPSSR